jgi:hypothetical protein
VVAERFKFDRDEALTMGRVVARLNAYLKGKWRVILDARWTNAGLRRSPRTVCRHPMQKSGDHWL